MCDGQTFSKWKSVYSAYFNTPLAWILAKKGLQDHLATVLDRPTDDGRDVVNNLAMEIENDVTLEQQMMVCSKYHKEIK